jgi:hypothetical protein
MNQANAGVGVGNAPTSLANLRPIDSSEKAKAMQLKSVEARKANVAAREALKVTVKDMKALKDSLDLASMPSSIDILKMSLLKAFEKGDEDRVIELSKVLAEYEAPKLQRIDQTNTNVNASDLSDEELQAELDKLK